MKVEQMTTNGGNTAANQFIIHDGDKTIFQSYTSIIAIEKGGKVMLDEHYWDYSVTTGRYRNQFLGEGIQETRNKIESGEYGLSNLN